MYFQVIQSEAGDESGKYLYTETMKRQHTGKGVVGAASEQASPLTLPDTWRLR